MCGICGQLRFDSQSVQTTTLEKMMQKIRRRGPDAQDLLIDKNIGFGHIHSFRGGAEALILHQRTPTGIRVVFLSEFQFPSATLQACNVSAAKPCNTRL